MAADARGEPVSDPVFATPPFDTGDRLPPAWCRAGARLIRARAN